MLTLYVNKLKLTSVVFRANDQFRHFKCEFSSRKIGFYTVAYVNFIAFHAINRFELIQAKFYFKYSFIFYLKRHARFS